MIKYSKIKDICEITNGYAFKSDKYVTDEGVRVIRITNVQKGKVVDNDPKIYPFSELSNLDTYKIYEGDILMSLTGNVGRVGKFPMELLPAYINQRVCRVKSSSDNLLENYLFHFLNSDIFENDARRNSAGAAQLNLSTKWVCEYEIPLPPLPTQQKIASILDAADTLRQKDKALLAKYDELTQSLFLDMFGDPVSNPKGWIEKSLGVSVDIITYGLTIRPAYQNEGIPVISAKEIKSGEIEFQEAKLITREDFNKVAKKGKPEINEILYTKTGAGIGQCAVVKNSIEFAITQNIARIKFKKFININYMLFYLRTPYIQMLSHRVSKGNAIKDLQLGDMKNFKLLLPPEVLQNQFAERIAVIVAQKTIVQKSLEKSESLFNSLLQKAFKGELV